MRTLEKHGLFTLSDYENVFQIDLYGNGVYIWCVPTYSRRMKELVMLSTFLPYNRPAVLNDIFMKLRMRQSVMNVTPILARGI